MEKEKNRHLGVLYCCLGAISWGISGTCGEALFRAYTVPVTWVTAVRMTGAGLLLLAVLLLRQKEQLAAMLRDRPTRRQLLLFTLGGLVLCQISYLSAIRWSNSGTATVLQNLSIVLLAGYVCWRTRRAPTRRQLAAMALALAGVWLIATGGRLSGLKISPQGLFWGLLAALGAAGYTLLSGPPVRRWGSLPVTGLGMLLGGCVMGLVAQIWRVPAGLDAYALLLLGILVLVGTVGAFTLFLQGISLVGPVTAALLGCLEPLTAALLSAVWLGSRFSPAELAGFGCILATVLLLRRG